MSQCMNCDVGECTCHKLIPSPGSPEAVERGCTCPELDNRFGLGAGWVQGEDGKMKMGFDVEPDCPLHGERKEDGE